MVSLLEGELQRRIAKAFKGRLTLGTLRRTDSSGVDSFGDAIASTSTDIGFEGIREDFSLFYKANSGVPETDVKILILLGSMTTLITPKEDDLIFMKTPWNKWYKCRRVLTIDPAAASCTLQAYEVPAP